MSSYACPECKGTNLRVTVEVWANLLQEDGNIQTVEDDKDGSHEWTENSVMECKDCGLDGIADEFNCGDTNDEAAA